MPKHVSSIQPFQWSELGSVVSRLLDQGIHISNQSQSVCSWDSSIPNWPCNPSGFLFRKAAHENSIMTITVKDFLNAPILKRKTFTPLPVRCSFQLPSQYHEHSLVLLFPFRICASGWRGWTLLRASRSVFWRSLDPSVWWELHTHHCPGHLCRTGVWQGCVCPRTHALQRVRWPGMDWRVRVWGGGAWAPGLPQSALSRGHVSPQWSGSGCLFRWDAGQN